MSAIAKLLPFVVAAVLLVTVAPLAILVSYSLFADNITPDASVEGEWNIFMGIGHLVAILTTNLSWVAAIGFGLAGLVTVVIGIPAAMMVLARRAKG